MQPGIISKKGCRDLGVVKTEETSIKRIEADKSENGANTRLFCEDSQGQFANMTEGKTVTPYSEKRLRDDEISI
jgi:hypothetical protein